MIEAQRLQEISGYRSYLCGVAYFKTHEWTKLLRYSGIQVIVAISSQ